VVYKSARCSCSVVLLCVTSLANRSSGWRVPAGTIVGGAGSTIARALAGELTDSTVVLFIVLVTALAALLGLGLRVQRTKESDPLVGPSPHP
jgi:hypothetical protein